MMPLCTDPLCNICHLGFHSSFRVLLVKCIYWYADVTGLYLCVPTHHRLQYGILEDYVLILRPGRWEGLSEDGRGYRNGAYRCLDHLHPLSSHLLDGTSYVHPPLLLYLLLHCVYCNQSSRTFHTSTVGSKLHHDTSTVGSK